MKKFFFQSLYSLIRKEKGFSSQERVGIVLGIFINMISGALVFLIFGYFNVRPTIPFKMALLLLSVFIISTVLSKSFFPKTETDIFIKEFKYIENKEKHKFVAFGIVSLVFAFILLFSSGILMSYLWSLGLY